MNFKISMALVLVGSLALSACQKEASPTPSSGSDAKVQVVNVGTEGTYAPFTYQDKSGKLTGYDVEVMRLIDQKIPDVEFNFVTVPWDSMFLGVDAGKYQIVANQMAKKPEREQKYLFSDQPYFVSAGSIVVPENSEIKSMEDLKGKTVAAGVGSAHAIFLEDYNKKNGNPITIKYYEGMLGVMLQDVASGKVDATINDRIAINQSLKEQGLKLKLVGEPINQTDSFVMFAKGAEGKKLKAKVDKALDQLRADGELTALAVKWFGEDFTQ